MGSYRGTPESGSPASRMLNQQFAGVKPVLCAAFALLGGGQGDQFSNAGSMMAVMDPALLSSNRSFP